MNRLLVVGAGATIEESRRSGNYKNDPEKGFPTIRNFCNKLFVPDSSALMHATASYLTKQGISFDPKMLTAISHTGDDVKKSPIGVFQHLELISPDQYNIERLCEHVWQNYSTANDSFWDQFLYNGIYFNLFFLFTEQFGLGLGVLMLAGTRVAKVLQPKDSVLNLNYDIAFDLALKQSGKSFIYAPETDKYSINVFKPHGSFNFYVDLKSGNCFFLPPDQIPGNVLLPHNGIFYSPYSGIIAPRLNKSYQQHPSAQRILSTGRPFSPKIVTFWGIGLTDSDVDLLDVYREASKKAKTIEFINPSVEAYQNAQKLLNKKIQHFSKLDDWFSKYHI